jgi:hypothetical protein
MIKPQPKPNPKIVKAKYAECGWVLCAAGGALDAIRSQTEPIGTDGDSDEIGEPTSSFRFGLASLVLMVGPSRRLFFSGGEEEGPRETV